MLLTDKKGKKLKRLSLALIFFIFSIYAYGGMTFIKSDTTSNAEVKDAGIYFNGAITIKR